MGQYELAKKIKEHDESITVEELVRITGLSKGSVDDQIHKLKKKGYIQKSEQGTGYLSNMSDSDLEKIKPATIREIMDDGS